MENIFGILFRSLNTFFARILVPLVIEEFCKGGLILHCNPLQGQYRASTGQEQGFPCVVFPHRKKPVFIAGFPVDRECVRNLILRVHTDAIAAAAAGARA